jgi:hypothetical protein
MEKLSNFHIKISRIPLQVAGLYMTLYGKWSLRPTEPKMDILKVLISTWKMVAGY